MESTKNHRAMTEIAEETSKIPDTRKTFFKTRPEKGFAYFNNTRVGSCSYVLVKNGQCLAIPFYIMNRRGRSLNHFKTVPEKSPITKSTYMHDYITFGDMHCGMSKKPLIPYTMESPRSRLPINGIISGAAINRASVELGDDRLINRKQWKSTYKDFFRKPYLIPVSNYGIASDMAKAAHMKINSS